MSVLYIIICLMGSNKAILNLEILNCFRQRLIWHQTGNKPLSDVYWCLYMALDLNEIIHRGSHKMTAIWQTFLMHFFIEIGFILIQISPRLAPKKSYWQNRSQAIAPKNNDDQGVLMTYVTIGPQWSWVPIWNICWPISFYNKVVFFQ